MASEPPTGAADHPVPGLDDLAARYLVPRIHAYREDSTVEAVVDGRAWMRRMGELFAALGAGDAVYIASYQLDPDLDLDGRHPTEPGYLPLGELLARLAAAGVDVRVILSGAVFAPGVPQRWGLPFRDNLRSALRLRAWRPDGRGAQPPPLAGRVLLDWSGGLLGSNHQKFTLVRRADELLAGVGGIDFAPSRLDDGRHTLRTSRGVRWGWHDAGVVVAGPAATDVWSAFRWRWAEAVRLPARHGYLPPMRFPRLNDRPGRTPPVGAAPAQPPRRAPGTAVQVLRSIGPWYVASILPPVWRRHADLPASGVHEVYEALVRAIGAARRMVYIEDQYVAELPGGDRRYELFSCLRAAAARGVKVILVSSGARPACEGAEHVNRVLNGSVKRMIVDRLPRSQRRNVGLWRVERLTVHSKIVVVDDVFSCVGSANIFSRSMVGVDVELAVATLTSGTCVRDLRVALWAEHLRAPLTGELRSHLEDLDLAMGIFRAEWLPPGVPADTWRTPGVPAGFAPRERELALVGPP